MEYKGQLKGFPQEVVERMLDYQVEQGNPRNVTVFEKNKESDSFGFYWAHTEEKHDFWYNVIVNRSFKLFFARYPKKLTNTYELW